MEKVFYEGLRSKLYTADTFRNAMEGLESVDEIKGDPSRPHYPRIQEWDFTRQGVTVKHVYNPHVLNNTQVTLSGEDPDAIGEVEKILMKLEDQHGNYRKIADRPD